MDFGIKKWLIDVIVRIQIKWQVLFRRQGKDLHIFDNAYILGIDIMFVVGFWFFREFAQRASAHSTLFHEKRKLRQNKFTLIVRGVPLTMWKL